VKEACLGIDLGTSNSALAWSAPESESPEVIEVPQLTSADKIGELSMLSSSLYLPHEGETVAKLPWEKASSESVVGAWAKERGATIPDRLVSSAKSWLCSNTVDRKGAILPWKSEITEGKVSPVEASRRYLEHLRHAWEQKAGESWDAKNSKVVLTVPASFDEVARTLTHEAAESAGWGKVTLLEEPQAALYAWLAAYPEDWRKQVKPGELVLVVDIGGGTTDFSLIAISDAEGDLALERISVGEHLLLGGDNMDLALAHALRAQAESEGHKLDNWQFLSLTLATRLAKERLFSDDSLGELPVAVASRGSSLFAKALSLRLERETALKIVLDGFLPKTPVSELPQQRRSLGLQEEGLAYVFDPAISRHLARFLKRSFENMKADTRLTALVSPDAQREGYLMPSAVLFNGGVFNAGAIKDRMLDLLSEWRGKAITELPATHLDLAVARGAAHYAKLSSEGKGIRIKAGTARSYYLGVEASVPSVPGYEPPIKGLCVVPQGIEEGSELSLAGQSFGLVTGEPVEFRFFSSAVRAGDSVGSIVEDARAELDESARLSVTLPADAEGEGQVVPVELDAVVTEVGTLELWMKNLASGKKWNLEFNVRPQD